MLKNRKKLRIIYMVMCMQSCEKILRLKAGDKIGNQHIAVKRRSYWTYPQHGHNYFEMEIIMDGAGIHTLNGVTYSVSKGDAYLVTPVDFHEIKASSPIELFNVSFDEICLSENLQAFLYTADFEKRCRFDGDDYERLIMALELLQRECEADSLCINQLLDYLVKRFILRGGKQNDCFAKQEQLTGMQKAVAYIALHFREEITLENLSEISGYSPTYFSELFRKFTGEGYIERVTALRINYAKALLESGLSVSNACFESGFGSLSNFLAVFKAHCGMPPSEYRKTANSRK